MRPAPWQVEGIDPGAREVARDAARRSGLSLGEWLNSLIIDAKEKTGAGSSRASDRQPSGPPNRDRNDAREFAVPGHHFADERHEVASTAQHHSEYLHETPQFDDISKEIDELKSRIEHLMRHTVDGAPQSQPDPGKNRIPSSPSYPNPTSPAGGSKYPLAAPPGSQLAETIARIDRQLDTMRRNARPAATPEKQSGVDEAFAEIAARQQLLDLAPGETAGALAAPDRESSKQLDIATLEHRLSDIADGIKKLQPSCRFEGAATELKQSIEKVAPRELFAGIEDQLRRLSGQFEAARTPAVVEKRFEELRGDLATLGRRIEEALPAQNAGRELQQQINALTGEIAALNSPKRVEEITSVLRGDLADIRAALKSGVPHSDVVAIEEALRQLAQAVVELNAWQRGDEIVGGLRRDIADVRAALDHAVQRFDATSVEDKVEHLAHQVARLNESQPAGEIVGSLRRDIANIHSALDAAVPRLDATAIEGQIDRLAHEVAKLNESRRVEEVAEVLRSDIAEMRATLHDAMPQFDVAAIGEQLHGLAHEIRRLQLPQRAEEIAAGLRADIADLRATVQNGARYFDPVPIEEQLHHLAHEVEKLQHTHRPGESVEGLRAEIADLRATLQSGMPRIDAASIEEQIRQLADQVARLQQPLRAEEITGVLRRDLDELGASLRNGLSKHSSAAIEEKIQALNAQVAGLQAPPRVEDIADALRGEIAKVGDGLRNAMPTDAIATLEREVRMLGDRVDAIKEARPEHPPVTGLESSLAELRERMREIDPARDVAALHESIHLLSRKADALASENLAPEVLHQLEQTIWALRDLSSQVASQDSVVGLSRDIHALADKIDRSGHYDSSQDVLIALEQRLAEMADAIGRRPSESAVPIEFESTIKKLADRLEATHIPTADPEVLKSLERRIISLDEKLDASESRLGRLDGVERGIDDLLVQLKELRTQNERKLAAIQQQMMSATAEAVHGAADVVRRDFAMLKDFQGAADRRTQETFEAVYGTVEQVVDRLATIEQSLRENEAARPSMTAGVPSLVVDGPPIAPPALEPNRDAIPPLNATSPLTSAISAAPTRTPAMAIHSTAALLRQPTLSDLPPDAPLEPGSGGRPARMFSNALDHPVGPEIADDAAQSGEAMPTRANFVAAARRAAHAVASEQADAATNRAGRSAAAAQRQSPTKGLLGKFGAKFKNVILTISALLLLLGALRLALDFFNQDAAPATQMIDPVPPVESAPVPLTPPSSPANPARSGRGAALETPPAAILNSAGLSSEPTLGSSPASGFLGGSQGASPATTLAMSQPVTVPAAMPGSQVQEMTGALSLPPPLSLAPQGATSGSSSALSPQSSNGVAMPSAGSIGSASKELLLPAPLPAAIGGKALLNAAAAGDPGASYEIAVRYAEGHNVPQDFAQAAAWFDHAARTGLAPAQFRLGSMYEKGLGVKKDTQEARRLYLAAADKGNAKAMHNLAVLYSEGLDGKPDYPVAAQWFRKAASFGVGDSQYNLAILYARGIGVERNMAESYKWFALAAKGGDKDAAKKRDDMATRLDQASLDSARQAVEAFVVERQPEEATATKVPPGGWDQVVAAAPAKHKTVH